MVDTHCHLDSCRDPDSDVVQRAVAAGVTRLATIGVDGPTTRAALATAREHEEVVVVAGCHPHETEGFGPAGAEEIERVAADPLVRAIGETGLDYFRDHAPRDDQRKAFEAQLDIAERTGLPVVIHTRAAEEDTFAILAERAAHLTVILHCFSAPDRAAECVERGYFCSFAGNVTYPKNQDLQGAARDLPADRILVETDAPYLSPQPLRGKPNEPANVVRTAELVADLRGVTYAELERTVEGNARRLFRW
ncbi:MAG: TatD family hydrolase [Thermoleophilaceae bacterium]